MRMMVFDRRTCRWRPWHGTRAAWLKLPHAVATGVCVASTAAMLAMPSHPPVVPAPRPPVTAPASASLTPISAFLPSDNPNPFLPGTGSDFRGIGPLSTLNFASTPEGVPDPGGNLWSLSDPALPDPPATDPPVVATTQVPEPGSLVLLAAAVFLLATARHVGLPRPIRHKVSRQ